MRPDVEIPAIKLPPSLIIEALGKINENEGDERSMRESLITLYRDHSSRARGPSEKTIMRAVIFPTLRHLDLIEGTWPDVRLNPNGRAVVNSHAQRGVAAAKRKLRAIVFQIDRVTGEVISALRSIGRDSVRTSKTQIQRLLVRSHHVGSEKEERVLHDRLDKWLALLAYLDFIDLEGDQIHLRVIEAEMGTQDYGASFDLDKFGISLLEAYRLIVLEEHGSFHVPIPRVRDKVCEQFPGMLKDDFYELLTRLKSKRALPYQIHLSQPMSRTEGGMNVGGKYYYFLGIMEDEQRR